MARRRGGVNTAFLEGEDPEADLMGKAVAKRQPPEPALPVTEPEPAAAAVPATPTQAPARGRGRAQPAPRSAARAAPRPAAGKRWQRVNVYLEPKTQGHWMNHTRGRLLEQDRGDIGVTEIVRLALDRLAEQLNVSELVADYDRRYTPQEEA